MSATASSRPPPIPTLSPSRRTPRHTSRLPLLDRSATPSSATRQPRWTSHIVNPITPNAVAAHVGGVADSVTSPICAGLDMQQSASTAISAFAVAHSPPTRISSLPTRISLVDKPLRPVAHSPSLSTPSVDSSEITHIVPPLSPSSPLPTEIGRACLDFKSNPAFAITYCSDQAGQIFEEAENSPKSKAPVTSTTVPAVAASSSQPGTGTPLPGTFAACVSFTSSTSSYEGANKRSFRSTRGASIRHEAQETATPDDSQDQPSALKRAHSHRSRVPSSSLIPQRANSTLRSKLYLSLAHLGTPSPTATGSWPHSPSSRSVSRPRPGSFSLKAYTDNPDELRTASRIPVAESRKPLIIDVKPRGSQGAFEGAQRPATFENRRLDSRTADILDNSIKRRQMLRKCRDPYDDRHARARRSAAGSDPTTLDITPPFLNQMCGSWLSADSDCQVATKSDVDLASSMSGSEDESEVTTPFDRPLRFSKRCSPNSDAAMATIHGSLNRSFDSEQLGLYVHSPSASPFTVPLPTIPSEHALPIRRLQEKEITEALSHLEGKGRTPNHEVDDKTLLEMFGHMAKTFESKNEPTDSSALLEDAAVAKKFLALAHKEDHKPGKAGSVEHVFEPSYECHERALRDSSDAVQPTVSKWSNTTPSEREERKGSQETHNTQDSHSPHEPVALPVQSIGPEPDAGARSHESIGYPLRVPAVSEALAYRMQNVAAVALEISRRPSSPTLRLRSSGPVRRTRDNNSIAPARYARPTKAAEARKLSKLPTPRTKTSNDQRGRAANIRRQAEDGGEDSTKVCKQTCEGDVTHTSQAPRTRSRSRYVMDKINGLFAGRRYRRSSVVPPVPKASPNADKPFPTPASAELDGTPMRRCRSPVPLVPVAPSPLPIAAGLETQASTATLRTGHTTLVGASTSFRVSVAHDGAMMDVFSKFIAKAHAERNVTRRRDMVDIVEVRMSRCEMFAFRLTAYSW